MRPPLPRPTPCALRLGSTVALWLGAGLGSPLLGCGATWPAVLDPTDIVDLREGTPRIARVRDLGAVHIGRPGPLLAESDGQVAIGELVLVEGSGFGKRPTLAIGGRPAEIRWRTEGGGIVVQVPRGSSVGATTVTVQSGRGSAEQPLQLMRLALLLDSRRGQLHTLRLGQQPSGAPTLETFGAPLLVAGARSLAMSADGAAAYVLSDDGAVSSVAIVDLVAAGGPRIVETRTLRHRAHTIVAAEQAPVLAIVGSDQLTRWDTVEPRRPSGWPAAALPELARGCRAAALSPDGERLALILPTDNQLLLLGIKPGFTEVTPRPLAQVATLPGLRQPLLHGLRFAADGSTIWLSAGDNPDSLAAGHQPTRLIAVELKNPSGSDGSDLGAAVLKTVDLRDAGPPLQLALGKSPPIAAGTTIRTPPEKTTIFLTTVGNGKTGSGGALWRSDLLGHLTTIYSGKESLQGLDVSPDSRLAVTARLEPPPSGRRLTVTDLESSLAVSLPLGPADDSDRSPLPSSALQILLQP